MQHANATATATEATTAPVTPQSIFPPRLGAIWAAQGGIYLGIIRGVGDQPDYHLITPANEEAELVDIEWGGYGSDEPGAKCRRDGAANTLALINSEHAHPAAEAAAKLQINGFSDYYLPSQAEMALLTANAPELLTDGDWYWTSTQYSSHDAWVQFSDGSGIYDKDNEFKARAVRRLVIQ